MDLSTAGAETRPQVRASQGSGGSRVSFWVRLRHVCPKASNIYNLALCRSIC
jgi:hypothetical protein